MFETLLLDNQGAILRSLLEVLSSRAAAAHVRPIVLLSSGRGCGLALVRHAVNHMLESAVAQGPAGMADLLEWWCDAELQADVAVSRGVVAMEAVASYIKVHINSALRARLEQAMRAVIHIRTAHSAAASPVVSSRESSRPTSPEGSNSTDVGTLNADVHAQLQHVVVKTARELLQALMPPLGPLFATTYAPPLHRLLYEVASLFEEFRPGAGPQGLAGLLVRGLLPAFLEPMEYGIALHHGISAHAVAEDTIRSAHTLAYDLQGCVQVYFAAQRGLSESLDAARLGRRRSMRGNGSAATPTSHSPMASGAATEPRAAASPPPAGSISAWCAEVLDAPVPDGPCVSVWEQERVTSRAGWRRLWPMSLNSIRQSVLANFSKLSPHLVGEVVTEVFAHETVDRFKVVMPLLEKEYVPDAASSAPQSPQSIG